MDILESLVPNETVLPVNAFKSIVMTAEKERGYSITNRPYNGKKIWLVCANPNCCATYMAKKCRDYPETKHVIVTRVVTDHVDDVACRCQP